MLNLDVVLVHADTDVGGVDFHQLRQRILQAPADADRPAEGRVVRRKLLAPDLARGIDAGARFVDDGIRNVVSGQLAGDQLADPLFSFAATGAVTDGDGRQAMFANDFHDLVLGFGTPLLAADQVHDAMRKQVAELVERGQFATAFEAGIQGQNATLANRRLQQQLAQVAGENLDGVNLGPIGQLAADFSFQAGQDESREGISRDRARSRRAPWPGRSPTRQWPGALPRCRLRP